ncbi:MAG TPA: hypothetical protein VFU63_13245 [Ktedonobacterales bacterium]|nr:hypothetical protein [Ktedonobacterales bacterium]
MNTPHPNGYRRIYPSDPSHPNTHSQPPDASANMPQSSHPNGQDNHQHLTGSHAFREQNGASRQNSSHPAGSLPAIRPTNPHGWSREDGSAEYSHGSDSRHVHFHHYYAYFLPPSPTRPQPQVAADIGRTFDERRRNGCAPTCLVFAALALGAVIALLVMAMGLALVGQMLALPSSAPPVLPTPPHFTPTPSGDMVRSHALAILPFLVHL